METGDNAGAVIDILGGSGILFTQLPAADAGETAVLSVSDGVKLQKDFTSDPDRVIHAFRMLRKQGGDAHILRRRVAGTGDALPGIEPRQGPGTARARVPREIR